MQPDSLATLLSSIAKHETSDLGLTLPSATGFGLGVLELAASAPSRGIFGLGLSLNTDSRVKHNSGRHWEELRERMELRGFSPTTLGLMQRLWDSGIEFSGASCDGAILIKVGSLELHASLRPVFASSKIRQRFWVFRSPRGTGMSFSIRSTTGGQASPRSESPSD